MSQEPSTNPPERPTAGGSLPAQETMTYQERRMSGQVAYGYETGRRRTSSFGSYTRVVVVAVDPSDYSKQAFDCEFTTFAHILVYCYALVPKRKLRFTGHQISCRVLAE